MHFWSRMCQHIAVVMTTQILMLENPPQEDSWTCPEKVPSPGTHTLWHTGHPPKVLRWASVISHWCFLSDEILPSVSQLLIQAGPQVVADGAEAVGSGRAPTCTATLIPHTGGDLSWAGKGSSVIENCLWMWQHKVGIPEACWISCKWAFSFCAFGCSHGLFTYIL